LKVVGDAQAGPNREEVEILAWERLMGDEVGQWRWWRFVGRKAV
jgi:hypothetical protein